MKKDFIYIKCWNKRGAYVGILAISSKKELENFSRVYSRFEYIS